MQSTTVSQTTVPQPNPVAGPMRYVPGLGIVLVIALVAWRLGIVVPVVGGPVFGIVMGMIVQALFHPGQRFRPGISLSSRQVLQLAVILLGTGLSLADIAKAGVASLPVMMGTMTCCLLGTWLFGRLLGVSADLRAMIGVGTGICGASAVAAVSGVIDATELDVAYAISTIFMFNVIAVLTYPTIGHLLHFSQHTFGLWAGTAINDVSSVVAAAYTYGQAAGNFAVIVKLTRTTLIIPIALSLAAARVLHLRREGTGSVQIRWAKLIPWFIFIFVLAALANSLGVFSSGELSVLSDLAKFFIIMALTAIGLSARFGEMRHTGTKPLLLGAILWATVGLSSLGLQSLGIH